MMNQNRYKEILHEDILMSFQMTMIEMEIQQNYIDNIPFS